MVSTCRWVDKVYIHCNRLLARKTDSPKVQAPNVKLKLDALKTTFRTLIIAITRSSSYAYVGSKVSIVSMYGVLRTKYEVHQVCYMVYRF